MVGGSGFVGSRVCKLLVERGADVSAVSQSGAPPEWCANADWAKVLATPETQVITAQLKA